MNLLDTYRYLVGAYYGVCSMDNYELKEYVMKDVKDYIISFINDNPINDVDYYKEAMDVCDNVSLKTKLQDALIVLPKVDAKMELILLIKLKIKEIEKK